jgi:hypothetical protein
MTDITNEHRARVYKELLSDDYDMNTAMLLAASKIPPEYENGGVEISAIKLFRAMACGGRRSEKRCYDGLCDVRPVM